MYARNRTERERAEKIRWSSWRSSHKLSIALEKFSKKNQRTHSKKNHHSTKSMYKHQSNLNETSLYSVLLVFLCLLLFNGTDEVEKSRTV